MATTDELALVRLYTADLGADDEQLLSDDQLGALITANDGALRLAAADALEAIAASEVLISKKIRTQDLSTDGPAVSAELRALARQQRTLHQEAVDADDDGFFDIVDTIPASCRPELTERPVVWGL